MKKGIDLRVAPVTAQNREALLALRPAPGQEGFVETVAQCLEEASALDCWRPVGLYDGNLAVGFAMYGRFASEAPDGRVWLDRLLIDARYQGRGYGRAALEALLRRIEREYRPPRVYLSVVAGNSAAVALYQSFGFRFNGERDLHGENVMVLNRR